MINPQQPEDMAAILGSIKTMVESGKAPDLPVGNSAIFTLKEVVQYGKPITAQGVNQQAIDDAMRSWMMREGQHLKTQTSSKKRI